MTLTTSSGNVRRPRSGFDQSIIVVVVVLHKTHCILDRDALWLLLRCNRRADLVNAHIAFSTDVDVDHPAVRYTFLIFILIFCVFSSLNY